MARHLQRGPWRRQARTIWPPRWQWSYWQYKHTRSRKELKNKKQKWKELRTLWYFSNYVFWFQRHNLTARFEKLPSSHTRVLDLQVTAQECHSPWDTGEEDGLTWQPDTPGSGGEDQEARAMWDILGWNKNVHCAQGRSISIKCVNFVNSTLIRWCLWS